MLSQLTGAFYNPGNEVDFMAVKTKTRKLPGLVISSYLKRT